MNKALAYLVSATKGENIWLIRNEMRYLFPVNSTHLFKNTSKIIAWFWFYFENVYICLYQYLLPTSSISEIELILHCALSLQGAWGYKLSDRLFTFVRAAPAAGEIPCLCCAICQSSWHHRWGDKLGREEFNTNSAFYGWLIWLTFGRQSDVLKRNLSGVQPVG